MSFAALFRIKKPDIVALTKKKDIRGLIKALRSSDLDVQLDATKALGSIGSDAVRPLLSALETRNKTVKLGIIGALAEIRSPESVRPLITALADKNSEVRWQAALALGEVGDPSATGSLVSALHDPDKYVRFAAALSLSSLGWKPADSEERAKYFTAMQEWKAVRQIGGPAVPVLTGLLRDQDSTVRIQAVNLLGATGNKDATPAIMQSLGDENRDVRWSAALAAPKCSIPMKALPRALARRPQAMKNPYIAGFLNFLLPGLGYGYLGKWWGPMIFQIDVTATVWLFKIGGDTNSYSVLLPIYLLLGLHAWYITTKIPRDPP